MIRKLRYIFYTALTIKQHKSPIQRNAFPVKLHEIMQFKVYPAINCTWRHFIDFYVLKNKYDIKLPYFSSYLPLIQHPPKSCQISNYSTPGEKRSTVVK